MRPPTIRLADDDDEQPPNTSADLGQALAYARELGPLYRAARARAARLQLLVEMDRHLFTARDLSSLLRVGLERAMLFSRFERGRVLLYTHPDGPDAVSPLEVRVAAGASAEAPGAGPDDALDGHVRQAVCQRAPLVLPRGIYLPLVAPDERALGAIVLDGGTEGAAPVAVDEEDLETLQLLAHQLAAAILSVRLRDALAERERRLQELLGRFFQAQEEERRRVAYDIHDGLAQVAAGAQQHLEAFASRVRFRAPETRQQLARAVELSQLAVREARRVIAGLRPTVLDDFGLATALRQEVQALQRDGWEATFEERPGSAESVPERLPQMVETALFRVAQEALNNARKHAGTTRVQVGLWRDERQVTLEVRDWGRGFRAAPVASGAGERIGLDGMQERVNLLGGRCVVRSRPGGGTRVVAEIPLARASAASGGPGAKPPEGMSLPRSPEGKRGRGDEG